MWTLLLLFSWNVFSEVKYYQAKDYSCGPSREVVVKVPFGIRVNWIIKDDLGYLTEYFQTKNCHYIFDLSSNGSLTFIERQKEISRCELTNFVFSSWGIDFYQAYRQPESFHFLDERIDRSYSKNCFVSFYRVNYPQDVLLQTYHELIPGHYLPLGR